MTLYSQIEKLAFELGFADFGCAIAEPLDEGEILPYYEALENGYFGSMEYLVRNAKLREDPSLLLSGVKSVLVFLAPFAFQTQKDAKGDAETGAEKNSTANEGLLKVSEFALGTDYHKVIKHRLNKIANLIDKYLLSVDVVCGDADCDEVLHDEETRAEIKKILSDKQRLNKYANPNYDRYKSFSCRVFADSAPIMERSWAVRAGLGFIGKNNFLISPKCGVKNFIGVVLTKVKLPHFIPNPDKMPRHYSCGSCTRCIDACSQKALFAPYSIDARKCLSYKTIEKPLSEQAEEDWNNSKWIFGCDDCMNACPWNKMNRKGWDEFHTNAPLLRGVGQERAKGETPNWWRRLSQAEFDTLFKESPLRRTGLEKILSNIGK